MSPFGSLLGAWLHPALLAASLFLGWWAVWFTLGRAFRETLGLLLAARAVAILCALGLQASGALGEGLAAEAPGTAAWAAAAALLVFLTWGVDTAVLGAMMRRRRSSSWRWDRYDFAVIGAAHAAHVAGALLLV